MMNGRKDWRGSKERRNSEILTFEWDNITEFSTLQHSQKVKELLLRLNETQRLLGRKCWHEFYWSQKNTTYVDVQRHFLWNKRQRNRMFGKCQTRISVLKKIWKRTTVIHLCIREDLEKDHGLGSEKKWYSIKEDSPQGISDNVAEKILEFAESGCPIFRATSLLSRGQLKNKGHRKLSTHYAADLETVETIFRIIVVANQFSFYGAVAEMCEDYETLHERTGRHVVMGQ